MYIYILYIMYMMQRVNDMLKLRKERFKENFIKPVDALDSDRRNKIERLREL